MKPSRFLGLLAAWVWALFCWGAHEAGGQSKYIQLRTGTIPTPPAVRTPTLIQSAVLPPESGLFLVQFEGELSTAWQEELRSLGVELLKYVPDHAFIARFKRVSTARIRGMSFVRWVGPYGRDQKIHPRLTAMRRAGSTTNDSVAVNVMLLPLATPTEIGSVKSLFSSIVLESHMRQGIFLRGMLPHGQIDILAQSSVVLWVEPAAKRKLVDELASKIVGGDDGSVRTHTVTQQLGFDGSGVTVCVADTGLDTGDTNTMHPDLRGRVTGFNAYGLPDGSDGYGHGTHCAGIVAGNAATGETDPDSGAWYGLGVASGANIYVERIFDENANEVSPFPSDETLTRDAVRQGAQIGSNSWGNDVAGEYDTDSAQFDELVRDADASTPGDQPYILEFSAGNAGSGSETVGSPATGKNVIATGASENIAGTFALTSGFYADGPDTMADFSSRGPCEDGRIKPDLVAPGTWIASLASASAPGEAAIAWSAIDNYYVFMGGTSMSGPHAAGAAAIFVQFYKSTHTNAMPSPALVKAALINSAVELDELNGGPGPIPNNDEGWGRITLTNLITTNPSLAPRYYEYIDQNVLLTTGQVFEHHSLVKSSSQPLKITLAYTDVPGFPGAIPALVNDLDLEVVGPDGTLYRGNQFFGSESVPNAPTPDHLNNVEGVTLSQPVPGDYLIRIRASQVVQDARLDTAAIDQDFALVISADLVRPNGGAILLDRPSYTAPGTVNVTVFDPARSPTRPVSVLLQSSTEPSGENYLLLSSARDGSFTGAVATVLGAARVDGQLEIHHGDSIQAQYLDRSGVLHVANAVADLVAPVLTGVTASLDLGGVTISWQSSEPATSMVVYGTNLNFSLTTASSTLTSNHLLRLSNLIPGKTYYFYVTSADAAGNAGTNNQGGAYFTFTGVTTPTALLVDDYDSLGESDAGSTVIPDGAYTNALAAAGVSYGFWKVNQRGYPQLSDLTAFPLVIWRTTDDIINYQGTNNTLTASQQYMIRNYLNRGGSFFMASMGILSQLGNVPFRKEILQVDGFRQNPDPPSPCSDCDEDAGVPSVLGVTGDPVSSGVNATLNYSDYPSFDLDGIVYGPDFSDTFTPTTVATPILFETVSGNPCAISYPRPGTDSAGRVMFLAFPLDTLPTAGSAPNTVASFLQKAVKFLTPGAHGVGAVSLDSTTYTVPDQVTVEVADSDLIGAAAVQVVFSNLVSQAHVRLSLSPAARPGLFRGNLTLVTGTPLTNQFAVHNGDSFTASYFDASNGSNVVASARVDTLAPVISQVTATASFQTATVSWSTSKPAGSLVEYGGSTLLDRAASATGLVTNHSVTITGLQANRVYFYAVVSRDAAGNTTVDDNHGTNYSFNTIPAPRPPWFDNMEKGAPGWSVIPDTTLGSEVNWSLGVPANGLQHSAHSGTNCWGSNLTNHPVNLVASSFLYSPFIDLSGFSQVTLTFWSSYDFSSQLEVGQLGVSTSSSTPPVSVPTLVNYGGGVALDWEQETVDLSAYAGQTIQVVWAYQGVTIGSPLKGWLVDDVAIQGVAGGGTVKVTKNLGQGGFTLVGPLSQQVGTAPSTTLSNLPPGPYRVQFSDVAFYQTPPDQSNNLANGSTLVFNGDYTFLDVNSNGISDAWEKYYFNTVWTHHPPSTDSDGDGMSDYAEFIAGTNPTNPASKFEFLPVTIQTNGLIHWEWASFPGRLYQLQSSTNWVSWSPVTDWLQASGSPTAFSLTNHQGGMRLFRVEVRP